MIKAFTGRATGRVQGVGYRYFAERCARQHSILGWVRNLPDGSVEFTAVGEAVDLDAFLLELKRGPLAGRVETLDLDWLRDIPDFRDFQITG